MNAVRCREHLLSCQSVRPEVKAHFVKRDETEEATHVLSSVMAEKRSSPDPEFIPIISNQGPKNKKRKSTGRSAYPPVHGDPCLIKRVRDLIITDSNSNTSQESIMDQLQQLYPEYRRKKKPALRLSVSKALQVLDDVLDDMADEGNIENTLNDSISHVYVKANTGNDAEASVVSVKKKRPSAFVSLSKQADMRDRFLEEPKLKYSDLGAIDDVIRQINKLVFHIKHPDLYEELGIDAPKGFLIHGPHGVGKTAIVEAIATELGLPFLKCASTELVTGISGESESKVRELFCLAESIGSCVLFIDEIDAISPRRDQSSREMEKRIVSQLVASIDSLNKNVKVIVVGATSRPDALDPALRRSGRFDREISLGIPDEAARFQILKVLTRNMKIDDDVNFQVVARNTPGYVGADLQSLIREAAIHTLEKRIWLEVVGETDIRVKMHDFEAALKRVQPSAKREGFATIPDVTWDDIGALKDIREELELSILSPIKFPDDVQRLGLPTSVGLLLCGPPGCGKTLLAKAIANESGLNFISVKGPELLNMYVGESERAVRSVFQRARNSKPCVVFFDEIDALCRKRSDDASSSAVSSSVVNQLLTEMDGLESRSCILLAATNRPDILDAAVLRPGRFDKVVYVGFPSSSEKYEILCTLTKNKTKPPCDPNVDLFSISNDPRTDFFSGADLLSLVREASTEALKDRVTGVLGQEEAISVKCHHFEKALQRIKPSTSKSDGKKYEEMRKKFMLRQS